MIRYLPDYKGNIHLSIKDRETGSIFELQISTKNMVNFYNRKFVIHYGIREIFLDRNIFVDEDHFESTYHDLIYNSLKKLMENPKYSFLEDNFGKTESKYLELQKEILNKLASENFSKIPKEEIIRTLEE